MGNNRAPRIQRGQHFIFSSIFIVLFLFLPLSPALATSAIAIQVASFCAPEPTVPDVGSCSACHSTTNNRGPNDLTAAGQWSASSATFSNFCPAVNTPPPTTPPPTPEPPGTPPGGPGTTPPDTGMGMGSGGDVDDDDDDDAGPSTSDGDDDEEEVDDDDGGGSVLQRIRSRLNAIRSRLSR